MSTFAFANERCEKHPKGKESGNDDSPPECWDIFQKLKKKKKIPFRTGREFIGRIGGWTKRSSAKINSKSDHCQENCEAGNRILKNLVGPKVRVTLGSWFLHMDTVLSEQIDMSNNQSDQSSRQNTGMEGEEPGEGMMSILRASHHDLL